MSPPAGPSDASYLPFLPLIPFPDAAFPCFADDEDSDVEERETNGSIRRKRTSGGWINGEAKRARVEEEDEEIDFVEYLEQLCGQKVYIHEEDDDDEAKKERPAREEENNVPCFEMNGGSDSEDSDDDDDFYPRPFYSYDEEEEMKAIEDGYYDDWLMEEEEKERLGHATPSLAHLAVDPASISLF